jgi:hypothetical protein
MSVKHGRGVKRRACTCGVREDLVVGKVVNTNLPFIFADNTILWILIGASVATGIAAIIIYVSSLGSKKRNNRIEELEERIRKLEAETEKQEERNRDAT